MLRKLSTDYIKQIGFNLGITCGKCANIINSNNKNVPIIYDTIVWGNHISTNADDNNISAILYAYHSTIPIDNNALIKIYMSIDSVTGYCRINYDLILSGDLPVNKVKLNKYSEYFNYTALTDMTTITPFINDDSQGKIDLLMIDVESNIQHLYHNYKDFIDLFVEN